MLYKSLRALSLVLSICFFVSVLTDARANPLYTVESVSVDVTSDNAINARNQAFGEAQVKAFKILVERLLPEAGTQSFQQPDIATISTLIKDYEVTREKLSSVRYIGTYTFRFKENAVQKVFTRSNQTYTDVQSKPLLMLPFYKVGVQTKLWAADNVWMQAWARSKNTASVVPMIVPIGDLADVGDIGDHQAMSYDGSNLSRMLQRYKAGEAVVLIATPDPHLSLVDNNNQPASGTLKIEIYRTDRSTPEYVTQMSVTANPNQTLAQLLDSAVAKVKSSIKKDWKARMLANAGQAGSITVTVPLQTLSDWADIQSALSRTGGVRSYAVKSLSPRQAQVQIEYQGDAERLALALDQANLNLTRSGPPQTASMPFGSNAPIVYILQKKSYGSYKSGTNSYSRTF